MTFLLVGGRQTVARLYRLPTVDRAQNRPTVGPYKPRPIFYAFMYNFLKELPAFSECFLLLAESDLVQTVNSTILYKMRMGPETKMSYYHLISRPMS